MREGPGFTETAGGETTPDTVRLLAAAPDMLAALKEVRRCPQAVPWLRLSGAWERLVAAIDKAEGRS